MQQKLKKIAGAFCALAFVAGAASAQDADALAGFHPFVSMGLTVGGDTIVTANYSNGSSEDINAGELFQFGAGVQWKDAGSPFAFAFSLNYHADTANASNGKAEFKRYPLEAIAYYRTSDRVRVGLGLRYVLSPEATYNISGGNDEKLTYDDAVGALAEVGFGVTPHFWVSLRAVSEEYKPKTYTLNGTSFDASGGKVQDGSHFGINMLYLF